MARRLIRARRSARIEFPYWRDKVYHYGKAPWVRENAKPGAIYCISPFTAFRAKSNNKPNNTLSQGGCVGVSTYDANSAVFSRWADPYLLPKNATPLVPGDSEWISQAALFCVASQSRWLSFRTLLATTHSIGNTKGVVSNPKLQSNIKTRPANFRV